MFKNLLRASTIILSCLLATACYKVEIQQGNLLTEQTVAQIERGMSREQVINRLGAPILVQPYHPNEMIYVYTLRKSYQPFQLRRLFIYFQNGYVSDFQFEHEIR